MVLILKCRLFHSLSMYRDVLGLLDLVSGTGVRRPLTRAFSETALWIQAKFMGGCLSSISLYQISFLFFFQNFQSWNFLRFLALLDSPSSVSPLIQVSQKPRHGPRPNFVESYIYISAISPGSFFFFFWKFFDFQIFTIFFFVFVNMGPYGSQNFKTLLLPQFSSDLNQTLRQIW